MAKHRIKGVVLLHGQRYVDQTKEQLAGAVFGQMQTGRGNPAGDGAADIQQIGIALGACAED